MGRLDGKIAIVTGSGAGIGRASSILFATEGASVAVLTRTPAHGQDTVKMLTEKGGTGVFVKCDVSKASEIKRAVGQVLRKYGRVDILFNNVGTEGPLGELKDLDEEEFDSAVNVNLKSAFLLSNAVIPSMIKSRGGVILNCSSTFGFLAAPNFGAYCMCKAGLLSLTRNYAVELAKYRIRVNAICPAGTTTDMHPRYLGGKGTKRERKRLDELIFESTKFGELILGTRLEKAHLARHPIGRFASPYDIAKAATFLVSDDSSYMTGSAMLVDGGYTIV